MRAHFTHSERFRERIVSDFCLVEQERQRIVEVGAVNVQVDRLIQRPVRRGLRGPSSRLLCQESRRRQHCAGGPSGVQLPPSRRSTEFSSKPPRIVRNSCNKTAKPIYLLRALLSGATKPSSSVNSRIAHWTRANQFRLQLTLHKSVLCWIEGVRHRKQQRGETTMVSDARPVELRDYLFPRANRLAELPHQEQARWAQRASGTVIYALLGAIMCVALGLITVVDRLPRQTEGSPVIAHGSPRSFCSSS